MRVNLRPRINDKYPNQNTTKPSSSSIHKPSLCCVLSTSLFLFLCFFINFLFINIIMAGDSNSQIVKQNQEMEGNNQNVLQKHVKFFDRNNDGIIYPSETFEGFRAIGCGVLLSSAAAVFINAGLSSKTRPGKPFSIHFPIEVNNIQMAKHGSDSGVYDTEGRFVPSKFEEIFMKHAQTNSNALTSDELKTFIKANRERKDYGGWVAGYVEWKILYHLCKDKNGLLHKDTIRAAYDGSLFEIMANEKASKQKK